VATPLVISPSIWMGGKSHRSRDECRYWYTFWAATDCNKEQHIRNNRTISTDKIASKIRITDGKKPLL